MVIVLLVTSLVVLLVEVEVLCVELFADVLVEVEVLCVELFVDVLVEVVLFCELTLVEVLLVVVLLEGVLVVSSSIFELLCDWLLSKAEDVDVDVVLLSDSPLDDWLLDAAASLLLWLLPLEIPETLPTDELYEALFLSFSGLFACVKTSMLKTIKTSIKTAAMINSHRLLLSFGASIVCFFSNEVIQ